MEPYILYQFIHKGEIRKKTANIVRNKHLIHSIHTTDTVYMPLENQSLVTIPDMPYENYITPKEIYSRFSLDVIRDIVTRLFRKKDSSYQSTLVFLETIKFLTHAILVNEEQIEDFLYMPSFCLGGHDIDDIYVCFRNNPDSKIFSDKHDNVFYSFQFLEQLVRQKMEADATAQVKNFIESWVEEGITE